MLTIAAFAVAAALGAPGAVTGLLAAAAAPAMFQIGRAGDNQAALMPLLTRFARWSAARAALQTATLIVMALAIAAGT